MKRSQQEVKSLLLSSVEKIARLTEEGHSPNDAAFMIAKEAGLDAPLIRRLCHAYNIGQQNFQRENAGTSAEKFAAFPIADPDAVTARLYPEVSAETLRKAAVAQSVDPDYQASAQWYLDLQHKTRREESAAQLRKAAQAGDQAVAEIEAPSIEDLIANEQRLKVAASAQRTKLASLKADLRYERGRLRGYFLSPAQDVSVAQAECHAAHRFGQKWASAIFDFLVGSDSRLVKQARFSPEQTLRLGSRAADWSQYPYSILQRAHELSEELLKTAAYAESVDLFLKSATSLIEERLRPTAPEGVLPCLQKAAAGGGGGGGAGGKIPNKNNRRPMLDIKPKEKINLPSGAWGREKIKDWGLGAVQNVGPARGIMSALTTDYELPEGSDVVDSQLSKFEDPSIELKIRKANIESSLHDLMANDPEISAHDPESVLKTYNELTQLNPRIADKPALLRVVLRSVLQSRPQVTDIETATRFGR